MYDKGCSLVFSIEAPSAGNARINGVITLLQVAVNNIMLVQILDAGQNLSNDLDRVGFSEFAPLCDAFE